MTHHGYAESGNAVTTVFTSVGRRVELLRRWRAATDALDLGCCLLATDIDELAPALQLADRTIISPRTSSERFIPSLLKLCVENHADVVFPLTDPDIPVLAAARDDFSRIGTEVAVMDTEAVESVRDKLRTARMFETAGVPGPATWHPDALTMSTVEYPVFVKPRRGSAAAHTFRADNQKQLSFFLDYVPDPVVQEFLPGPEITIDMAYSLDGRLYGLCQRQRIAVRSGEVQKGVTVWRDDVADYSMKIGEVLNARGPITVQCMMRDDGPVFTEVNGRFGGGLPLSIAAGFDVAGWYLRELAGLAVEPPPPGSYKNNLYMTRFDDSFFIEDPHG